MGNSAVTTLTAVQVKHIGAHLCHIGSLLIHLLILIKQSIFVF